MNTLRLDITNNDGSIDTAFPPYYEFKSFEQHASRVRGFLQRWYPEWARVKVQTDQAGMPVISYTYFIDRKEGLQ